MPGERVCEIERVLSSFPTLSNLLSLRVTLVDLSFSRLTVESGSSMESSLGERDAQRRERLVS